MKCFCMDTFIYGNSTELNIFSVLQMGYLTTQMIAISTPNP
jgi:hypothetical protein